MFDIVSKAEYWQWLEDGVNKPVIGNNGQLKHIQDTFVLAALNGVRDRRILEFGGGHSRVLKHLSKSNECWNVDKFEGAGAGPKRIIPWSGSKVVKTFMGDFDTRIPNDYFDFVFSISVLEHVPGNQLANTFADCARILKPGGELIQAVDLYLPDASDKNDPQHQYSRPRLDEYLKAAASAGFVLKSPNAIGDDAFFRGSHASNSDITLYFWNSVAPKLRKTREHAQSVSLKAWWIKPIARQA